ncbi:hypothetical protein KC332_g11039 [Hortaea werneckii]|uniref:Zinc finger PHD-type domain-containing protein n=1 Tax=Hortaea werneckii TaxID=91943 RepID=A0A3M7J256_HORWE|nr:hypothetical protein KC358_g9648 [Hortaea werneckii]KAI6921629.1 hypothetical protein KC348_g10088 [Hortaea werneckii]KAI6929569.1 hypothetical protein KC341_g10770 [Hortaea werneckii]KAI6963677.1 hypothetical protein KC321_g11081 [Hortaea werneckii]KAI6976242.1 hypothetical protein KC329_g11255 [Hortaea werneckii]
MPPKDNGNPKITIFFKRFTVPKDRVPTSNTIEDEIIVAPPRWPHAAQAARDADDARPQRQPASSPAKKKQQWQPQSSRSNLSRHSSQLSDPNSVDAPRRSPRKQQPNGESTPNKGRAAQQTPTKRLSIPVIDGTHDERLYHSSPTSSQQRPMTAVAIPPPSAKASPSPTPRTREQAPAASNKAFPSFSSTSTLSTAPPMSSQSSSRRTIRNGLQMVTNSDSGSESDEELPDLDSFIPRKKLRMTPPEEEGNDPPSLTSQNGHLTAKPGRQSARVSDRNARKSNADDARPRRSASPPHHQPKYSLAAMVAQKRKDDASAARVAKAQEAMAAADKEREERARLAAQEQDSAAVAEGLGVDSDEGARLKKALKRTGVGETEEKFEFFQRDIVISQTHGDFPLESLSDGQSWTKLFKDEATRIQTCVSGFATELAQMGLLGKQTISWFIEQIPIEENEGLREAYVDVVSASSAHPETVDAATLASFRNFYYTATFPNGSNSHQVANAKRQGGLSQNSKTELNDDDIVKCICGFDSEDGDAILCKKCCTWQHRQCYYYRRGDGETLEDVERSHQCVDCRPRAVDVVAAQRRLEKRRKYNKASLHTAKSKQHLPGTGWSEAIPGLRSFVRLMGACSPLAGIGGVCTALADLALANLDDFVRRDAMLRFAIHDTIKALCDQLDVAGLEAVYQYFKTELLLRRPVVESDAKNKDGGEESKQVQSDEKSRDESEVKTNKLCLSLNLQCRLVSSLPTGKSTLRLLRRKLALLLITRSDRGRPLESEDWTAVILNRLRKWRVFQITEATDYALLASLVDVLDIAIGPGFSDFAFLNKPSEKAEQQQPPTGRLHFGRNAHTPRTSSPEEHAFNSQIDTLTQMLQKKSSHIKDGSMSDLQRTEAKAVLGRVIMRLEHAVRTRPKLKRGVFDDGPDAESVGLMDGFVKRDGGKNEGREVMGMEEGAAGLKYSEVDGRQVEDTSAGDVDMVPDDQADDAVDTVSGAEVDSEGKGHRQRGESEEQHPAESRRLWGFGIGDVRM